VSLDPSVSPASINGPLASTGQVTTSARPGWPAPVTQVEVLPLQAGDRLIIHVDGAAGISAGGAHQAGQRIRDALKLGDLPFDVPVIVVSPGIRVQVARPS
jgi:hypothetical protein